MEHLIARHDASERRACRLTGQHRSTQRRVPVAREADGRLLADMRRLAVAHPRYGYRRIHQLLLRGGWRVNRKRVQRLWREEGMRVPRKRRKRWRLGHSGNSCTRRRAEQRNHVWSYDFIFDRLENGRQIKILIIVDEYTRECLALRVARSIRAVDVIEELAGLVIERGAPEHIRSDNGPEFIAAAIRQWIEMVGTDTLFVAPGSPWENAYAETFNSRLRDELLAGELFTTLAEARYLVEQYRAEYNTKRPHSSLDYLTPAEFAASCTPSASASLRLRVYSSGGQSTHLASSTDN